MQSRSSQRTQLNYLGIAILILGLGTAEFIYWRSLHTADQSSDDDLLRSPENARVYEREVESQVGTFGLVMVKFSHAVGSLEEPRPLAITIGVVASLAAAGCFLLASHLPPEESSQHEPPQPG
jgi:hypothetical protein